MTILFCLAYRETVFCGMRITEFEQRIICGTFRIKISANYTLFEFRIPQSAFRKIHRPFGAGIAGAVFRDSHVLST